MAVPAHVKLVVALVSAVILAAGCRDILSPGMGLPLPDDDKVISAVFGSSPVGACGKKEVGCVPGRLLFLSQGWGAMAVTQTLAKLVSVFSHPEGTFLRRNLFATFGLCDLLFASIIYKHEAFFNAQGASGMGFMAAFGLEGAVLLLDAFTRIRATKKAK